MDGSLSDLLRDFRLETRFRKRYTIHVHDDPDAPPSTPHRLEYWQSDKRAIGRGGQGQVVLQKCISGGRNYSVRAVKMIPLQDGGTRRRYIRELETMIKFSHDKYSKHFVKSLGWYETDESLCIAMEYYPAVMHGEGFAHRDIKPQNILIHQSPTSEQPGSWWVKLADFGISKRLGVDVAGGSTVIGTEEYMAPELFEQHSVPQVDHQAADMWALGVMTFFILTKTRLFQSRRFAFQYEASPDRLFPRGSLDDCNVSSNGQEFIRSLIRPNPEERPDCNKAMGHSWVLSLIPSAPAIPDLSDSSASSSRRSSIGGDVGLTTELLQRPPSAAWSDEITNDRFSESHTQRPNEQPATSFRTQIQYQYQFAEDYKHTVEPIPNSEGTESSDTHEDNQDGIDDIIGAGFVDAMIESNTIGIDMVVPSLIELTPLFRAARDGDLDEVQRLLHSGADIKEPSAVGWVLTNEGWRGQEDSWTPIFAATANGHTEVVKLLLENGDDAKLQDGSGQSLIQLAGSIGHPHLFKLLIDNGADVMVEDENEDTAIDAAAHFGRIEVIQYLTKNRANFKDSSEFETSLFNSVVDMGYMEAFVELFESRPDFATNDMNGWLPIHRAASEGHTDIAELLIKHGVAVSPQDKYLATPIHYAAKGGHTATVRLLLGHGAEPNIADEDGMFPIHEAAKGPVEMTGLLLTHGADTSPQNEDGCTALHIAVTKRCLDVVEELLQARADPNVQDGEGKTPLYLAAETGNLEAVRVLLEYKADASIKTNLGRTVLFEAVYHNNMEILWKLLGAGALPEAEPEKGASLLFSVAYSGKLEIAKWFIRFGADVPGYVADMLLEKAEEQGDEEMAKILKK